MQTDITYRKARHTDRADMQTDRTDRQAGYVDKQNMQKIGKTLISPGYMKAYLT
jgi:hypothetical protein